MPSFDRLCLSGSGSARQIPVTQTVAPGALVHISTGSLLDEVYLYAINNGTATLPMTVGWGGTTASDLVTANIPNQAGRIQIADGKIITNGTIYAYTGVTSGTFLAVDGFVNRITPDVDTRTADWVNRVIANGGTAPSLNTQIAVSLLFRDMTAYNLMSKMVSVITLVPDNLIAATTPLLPGPAADPWTNNNFVSSDLTINGLAGNTTTKYLNTSILPVSTIMTSTSAGLTAYVYDNTPTTSGYAFGLGGAANSSHFSLFLSDSAGTKSDAFCWRFVNLGTDWVQPNKPGSGYFSMSRTASNRLDLYFANSATAHSSIANATGAQTGSIITDFPLFAFALNGLGTPSSFHPGRISFMAVHIGLSATDSFNFYNAIQAFRIRLGGGFA